MAQSVASIGRLECALGNAAFSRVYSAYLGNAISLITAADGTEWLGPRSAEFGFTLDGRVVGLLEAGYVEWIDDTGLLGAALTQRRMGDGIMVKIEEIALERRPILLRRLHLVNLGHGPLHVSRAAALDWALRGRTEVHPDAPGALVCRSAPETGLFLAAEGLVPEAERGELDTGRLIAPGERTLAPGETWSLPVIAAARFAGPVAEAWGLLRGAMREAAEEWLAAGAARAVLGRALEAEPE